MNLYIKYVLIGVLFSETTLSHATEGSASSKSITLDEALSLVRTANFDVRKSLSDLAIAKSKYNGTNSLFLPTIELSENYTTTNDPLNVFGFKLKQGITTANDFNPDLLNNPESITNFNTRIEIIQPIINPDGFVQRSASKDYFRSTQHSLNRTIHYVEFQVKQQYAALWLAHKSIESVEVSLKSAREAKKLSDDNFEAGYILAADVLAAELYVLDLETRLEESINHYENTSDHLKFLLQINEEENLLPLEEPSLSNVANEDEFILNERSDFKALSYQLSGSEKMLRASKFRYAPSLNAQFGYEWNDDNIFGTTADNYLLGVSLRWRIFDGYKTISGIQQRKSEYERLNLEYDQKQAEANLEIVKATKHLDVARKRLAIAEKIVARAEEIRRLTRDRFEEGLEKTSDLVDVEASLTQKLTDRLNASYQVAVASYTLEYLKEQSINE